MMNIADRKHATAQVDAQRWLETFAAARSFDEGGELRNMWVRTAQPGLWFTAGSLAQCRIYSRYLAIQIKALEEGLVT